MDENTNNVPHGASNVNQPPTAHTAPNVMPENSAPTSAPATPEHPEYLPRRRAQSPAQTNAAYARRDTAPPQTSRPGADAPYTKLGVRKAAQPQIDSNTAASPDVSAAQQYARPGAKSRNYNAPATRRLGHKGIAIAVSVLCVALIAIISLSYLTKYLDWAKLQNYPFEYGDEINRYANEYMLDPALVAAVIYCESTYRPNVVSSADARGLMQIVPDTGEWIAGKLNESDYSLERLFEPELNIRYGCWYLNYLTGKFDGNTTNILAAYNAGPGRVDEWLRNSEYSSDGVTVDNIPYRETKRYVKKVKAAHDIYLEKYFTADR